jgi:surfeit locus 1 family protein
VKRIALLLFCLLAAIGFAALGVWQLERRTWKLDLIARIEMRIHAPPVSVPSPSHWAAVTAERDEYRRVLLHGHYLNDHETLVDALTELGPGFWVMTPLVTHDGSILINRGFVPPNHKSDFVRQQGEVAMTGLMRMPEPAGRFLRPNKPQADLWYSRDLGAIAVVRHLGSIAPFFVDAEATGTEGYPVGGLTVVQFRNMHLVYALIWFVMSALSASGAWVLFTEKKSIS